jgi:hypothetical protein
MEEKWDGEGGREGEGVSKPILRKFRTIRELLNYFLWTNKDLRKLRVYYIDRPKGISEFSGEEIEDVGYKFVYLKSGTPIPTHRILKVKYEDVVWWSKVHRK